MLFFFAGYEINFERIEGQPLKLGAIGWIISLVLAYALAGVLGRGTWSSPASTPDRRWRRRPSAR